MIEAKFSNTPSLFLEMADNEQGVNGEWSQRRAPLMTRWANQVLTPSSFSLSSSRRFLCLCMFLYLSNLLQVSSSKTPHPDHPRPLMERKDWKNLNGAIYLKKMKKKMLSLKMQEYGSLPSWLQLIRSPLSSL